jgi:ribonuclease P protein component
VKKRVRLTRHSDFQRVLGSGRLYSGRGLVAFAVPRSEPGSRVGVAASRRIRGAVARNRARRRLREVARRRLLPPGSPLRERGIGYDVVLIARPAALSLPFAALEADAAALLARIRSSPA